MDENKHYALIDGNVVEFNCMCRSYKDTIIGQNNYLGYGKIIDRELEGYYHFWYVYFKQ